MIIKKEMIYTPKNEIRMLHIYLPDHYDYTNEQYPVMYFYDGHNLYNNEDATYGKSWGLKEFLQSWSKDMIVVGIECTHEGEERLNEYSPYPVTFRNNLRETPLGKETVEWIIHDIKPMIDQTYRTYPFRECTGIAGASMGGLMALYALTHYNQYFSKAGCLSSSIGFCLEPLMNGIKHSSIDPDTRVYLSWGTKEAHGIKNIWEEDTHSFTYQWNKQVAQYLETLNTRVKLECQVGGAHGEADWEKLVPSFMNFLWLED